MTDNQKGKTTNVSDSLSNRSLIVSTILVLYLFNQSTCLLDMMHHWSRYFHIFLTALKKLLHVVSINTELKNRAGDKIIPKVHLLVLSSFQLHLTVVFKQRQLTQVSFCQLQHHPYMMHRLGAAVVLRFKVHFVWLHRRFFPSYSF